MLKNGSSYIRSITVKSLQLIHSGAVSSVVKISSLGSFKSVSLWHIVRKYPGEQDSGTVNFLFPPIGETAPTAVALKPVSSSIS